MNKITEAASKIMHLGNLEESAEQPKPEEQPAEQPQQEEPKPQETPQEQPAPEQPAIEVQSAAGGRPTPLTKENQPAIEPPPTEPSTPEAPKQQEPHPAQPTESQTQKPKPEGQPLSPSQRVDAAYKLVYGEEAEVPTKHEAIVTPEAAEWQIRYYMGDCLPYPTTIR